MAIFIAAAITVFTLGIVAFVIWMVWNTEASDGGWDG